MPTPLFNDDKAAYKLHFFPPYLMHMLLIHPTRPDYMNNSPFLQHIMSTRNHKVLSISNISPMMLFLCFHMLQITQGKREASYVLICCSSRKIKSVASLLTYRYALQQLEDKNCTYSTYCCYLDI
jgi:hypothetical protein